MKFRTLARAGVTAAAATALCLTAVPANAQEVPDVPPIVEMALVCDGYIRPESIQIPGYVNCMLDYTGNYITYLGQWTAAQAERIGTCIFYYDPLFSPIPSQVVPQTVILANCLV